MRRSDLLLAILVLASVGGFAALGILRSSHRNVAGDELTYIAMTASVADDGDLAFGPEDLRRLPQLSDDGRRPVILQRTPQGIHYSKPAVYPLLAAPFYRVMGVGGMAVLNAIALGSALWLAVSLLRRRWTGAQTAWLVATFAGASVLLPYLIWRTSDAVQLALSLAGLVLALGGREAGAGSSGSAWRLPAALAGAVFGGLCLGLLGAMRYPNLLVLMGALAVLALERRPRRLIVVLLAGVVAFGGASAANRLLAGAPVPYKATRASFTQQTGYPAGADSAQAEGHFQSGQATTSLGVRPDLKPRVSAWAGLFFWVGRHTGLLVYFPAVLPLLIAALGRPDRRGLVLLATAAAMAVFFLLWWPFNYFGGAAFVGNRYFLAAYPLLLLAVARPPRGRWLAVGWGLAAIAWASALASVLATVEIDRTSQSHAHAGLFRLLPYESTGQAIEGRRDRYWSGDFVRFTDPFPRVGERKFVLDAGRPAAELMIASNRPAVLGRLWVYTEAEEATLTIRDADGRRELEIGRASGSGLAAVDLALAAGRPRHGFWWDPAVPQRVTFVRLGLETEESGADGAPADARIRYLGGGPLPEGIFHREVLECDLPAAGRAGRAAKIRVRLVNRGDSPWTSDSVAPVYLSYRIWRETPEGRRWQDGPRTVLEAPVPPGEELTAEMTVQWPREPGEVGLVVDLLLEEIAWFADRIGEPVAEGRVRLEARGR